MMDFRLPLDKSRIAVQGLNMVIMFDLDSPVPLAPLHIFR
jgi:hypothetical protein